MANKIEITPATGTWSLRAAGAVLGESSDALKLTERDRPFVIYFPRDDISMAFFERSATSTTCPHKGTATYYDLVAKSGTYKDVAWSYEEPKAEVSEIAGHLAFAVNDHVTVEQL